MGLREELANDPEEMMRIAMDGRQSDMYTAMPAIVTSVDFTKMTIACQVTIQAGIQDENGNVQYVNIPPLINVPICFPSGGGFTITMPIASGDEVLVLFASRCIDAWWQSGGVQKPAEQRMHDLSDGFAIPGPKSVPKAISGVSSSNLQIRNNAGTSYIEITPTGKINIVAPTGLEITGNVLVTGSLHATANIGTDLVALNTHIHSGVTTGGGDSGPPV